MLDPLSKALEKDLTESQKEFFLDLLQKSDVIGAEIKHIPPSITLDSNNKALVRMENGKNRVQSIYEVMTVLQEVIDLACENMKPSWLNNERLIIQRPIINVESEQPAIVFKVLDGKPGAAGSGPVNSPSRRMVTPIIKGRYIDPNDASTEIYIYGQRLDYNIGISIYGKTAHEADILKEWVEDIIKTYLWYVRYSGVLDFTFVEDNGDETEALRHKRTLRYAVSVEKLTWSSFFILKQIIIKLSTLQVT